MSDLILLDQLPDFENDYEAASVDLSQDYWTPEEKGDSIRGFYFGIRPRKCLDQQTDKEIDLDCVVLIIADEDGKPKTVANGSKRLVGIFETIEPETPVQITFQGKRKNRSNPNMSDTWSVVILKKKGE